MLKTCMPVALAAFVFVSVSAPNAEAFEMRHGARMAPANFKAMRHGEFVRGGHRHGLRRHSHRHFRGSGGAIGLGLGIGLGMSLLANSVRASAPAAETRGVLVRPKGACPLSLDHYMWTADNASMRFSQWRDTIRRDNPARAQQMAQFRNAYNKARACVYQISGKRLPSLG